MEIVPLKIFGDGDFKKLRNPSFFLRGGNFEMGGGVDTPLLTMYAHILYRLSKVHFTDLIFIPLEIFNPVRFFNTLSEAGPFPMSFFSIMQIVKLQGKYKSWFE